MKKKIKASLLEKSKDFGLTEKMIDELVNIGSESLKDDATEDEINKCVDSLTRFAKATQGEVTRKTRKDNNNETSKDAQSKKEGAKEVEKQMPEGMAELMDAYMKPYVEQVQKLQSENEALKLEKAANARKNSILAKADELSIPRFLVENYAFGDDADIATELTAFKQKLVNEKLMPKDATVEVGNVEESFKASASAWADNLPNA